MYAKLTALSLAALFSSTSAFADCQYEANGARRHFSFNQKWFFQLPNVTAITANGNKQPCTRLGYEQEVEAYRCGSMIINVYQVLPRDAQALVPVVEISSAGGERCEAAN